MTLKIREKLSTAFGRSALRRRLALLGMIIAVGTGVLVGLVLELRADAIAKGEKVLIAFAQLTDEQTTRTLQNVEQTLEVVQQRLATLYSEGSINEDSVRMELRELLATRPFLNAIVVLDRKGRSIYRSDGAPLGVDLSKRDYFVFHRDNPEIGFRLSAPLRAQVTGEWIVPASRGLRGADGEFAGTVVAALDPLFFSRTWTVEKAIPEQATALWNADAVLFMRSPFDERTMGVELKKGEIGVRIRAGSAEGTLRTISLIDGRDRLVAYRRLAAYPQLTLSISQPVERVLATWRRIAWIGGIGWAFAAAALAWLAVELLREGNSRQATQDRYRVMFDANPYPMVVMDRDSRRPLAVNDAAVAQYGWTREESLAMKADDFYPPADLPAVISLRAADRADKPQIIQGLRHRKKDGTIFHVEMHTGPMELDGKAAMLMILEDVTTRRAVEDQLRQSQKMEAVGQLTGGIAHDFNNILYVIIANTDALQEEEKLEPRAAARLDEIGQAVQRAAGLTRQLLAFSRKQPLSPQRTDLNDLVAGTGKLLHRALGEHIEIESLLADDLCAVNIDRSQLETALVNLCLNARDAMPRGGKLLIETSNVTFDEHYIAHNPEAAPGAYAMLAVSDAGTGIAPAELDKVFEPFFTTKEVGKGTGLGLSMVYGFIHQSKGHIKIYSEVGRGTSVKLYLPASDGQPVEVAPEKKAALPRGSERILVVEDEPQVRANVVLQLKSLGYEVSDAPDGGAGLAVLEAATRPFDLLLTDVVMPGSLNGKALADEVTRRRPTTKVVFMSGYTESSIVHHGRLDEGVMLLSKPFRKVDLARIVRQALDGVGTGAIRVAEHV